ncbi:hypothetical protein QJS04_geneDACA010794 [Acorus gramineus]|uniref:Uncharacterized protein n=1 Tax=Acorus gramineus TaxID=55184 RepID=A0AAV9BA41_ACOGR|nr:hypothetical protein QJS04_geneDACA010794 [Acorus gramineus]
MVVEEHLRHREPPQKPTNLKSLFTHLLLFFLGYLFGSFSFSTTTTTTPSKPTSATLVRPQQTTPPTTTDPVHDLYRFRTHCADPIPPNQVRQTLLSKIHNTTSPFESFPPPHLAHLLRPRRVRGWGSTGSVFETLLRRVRPKVILELGTFLGASALHMHATALRLGLRDVQIVCIDDFRGWPGFRNVKLFRDVAAVNGDVVLMYQFLQNVVDANATGSVVPVPFSTGSALASLCEMGVYADLIEVDAGHDFHSAWADINRAYALLRPGGVMFGHDYFTGYDDRGVRRAVNLFAKVRGLKVRPDGQHWVLSSD